MEQKKRYRQSRQVTRKIIGLIIAAAVSMGIMAILVDSMQTRLYQESYQDEIKEYFEEIPEYLAEADAETERNTTNFDMTYQSLAQSVAYMANHDAGYAPTYDKMKEYQELFDVDNVSIVTRDGVVVAQANLDSSTNYYSNRFNQLRTVFEDGKPSEAVEIDLPDEDWEMRYYSARIDDNTMVVIQKDPTELRQLIEESGSLKSIFGDWTVGENGLFTVISAQDYTVQYHPDDDFVGKDGLSYGLDPAFLEDGNFGWQTINGTSRYCGVVKIDDLYFIALVPRTDMTSSRNIFMAVILVVFAIAVAIVIMHGIFVMREEERQGISDEKVGMIGPFRYNKSVVRRAAMIMVIGFVVIVGASYYMQTLFALSSQSVSNRREVQNIVSESDDIGARVESLNTEYEERYLPICQVVGHILDKNPDLMNQADLQEIADILNVQTIIAFDGNGALRATNDSYTNYEVKPDDVNDWTYDFLPLLQSGGDYVIQDEYKGDTYWQNIGVPLHNAEGYVDGLVTISIHPALLEDLMETANITSILEGMNFDSSEFAFVVDKEKGTFVYYPLNRVYEGESVLDHGMTESELKDGFTDYITLDGVRYYAASAETDDYYVYLAGSEGEMMSERLPLTVATSAVALLCLFVIFLIEIHEPKRRVFAERPEKEDSERIIETEMPNGRRIVTESAASRWLGGTIPWNERTAWQKTVTILRWMLAVVVAAVCIMVVFQNQIFSSNSIFAYILSGNWERGLNIFAITACIMFICVAMTIVIIIQRILTAISDILSAHGETICRMLSSFLKYATIIGMTFYCLYLIGIDGTTLLASAGILSLAITFGAQSLVTDILSGLFIIFEGEFRVGDIIKVDDWRGTVLEIGIRTTKVQDGSQNVKVIRNSDINNVINMTKKESFLFCDFSIEYEESLERVEKVLEKELPLMAERLPAIKEGPFYKGVTELGESAVIIRITMRCLETDRPQLERDVNREIKLIFDRNHINIPYNQIVVHEAPPEQEDSEASESPEGAESSAGSEG